MTPDFPTPPPRRFGRGARPSPRHRLLGAIPHRPVVAPPPQFAMIPGRLSFWDNETDGVCVSSEEAFGKAAFSVFCGLTEVFASEQEVHDFAARHGWLDGASLVEVLDVMTTEGMSIGGTTYKDGPHSGVDYSDETTLKSALTVGPVKIAVDADALPPTAGQQQGWYATAGGRWTNTDHCVSLCGYGPAGWLYQQLGVPLPAALSASTPGYLLFTWGSIGFVTHAWLMGTCVEAWVRSPTTVGESPAPPPVPPPPVPPPPVPPVPPWPPVPPVPPTPPPAPRPSFLRYEQIAYALIARGVRPRAVLMLTPRIWVDMYAGMTDAQVVDDCVRHAH